MRQSTRKVTTIGAALVAALLLPACGAKRTVFLDTQADFTLIQRVAVLPFDNLTSDAYAGDKVRNLFVIELLSMEVVDVVDPGEVARVLADERIEAIDMLGPKEIASLGEKLNAQAVILGSVEEFGMERSSAVSSPHVSLTCRLLETETGRVLWSVAVSREGAGAGARLFGISGDSATEAARKMVHDALKTLVR